MKQYRKIINKYSAQLERYSRLYSEEDFKDFVGVSLDSYEKRLKNISLGLNYWKLPDVEVEPTAQFDLCHKATQGNENDSDVLFDFNCEHSWEPNSPIVQLSSIQEPYELTEDDLLFFKNVNHNQVYDWQAKAELYQELIALFEKTGVINVSFESNHNLENEIKNIAAYFTAQGLDFHKYLDIKELYYALYWRTQYGAEWKNVYVALNSFRDGCSVLDDIEEIIFHGRDKVFCCSPSRIFLYEYFDLLFTVKWVTPESDLGEPIQFLTVNNKEYEQKKYKCAA